MRRLLGYSLLESGPLDESAQTLLGLNYAEVIETFGTSSGRIRRYVHSNLLQCKYDLLTKS